MVVPLRLYTNVSSSLPYRAINWDVLSFTYSLITVKFLRLHLCLWDPSKGIKWGNVALKNCSMWGGNGDGCPWPIVASRQELALLRLLLSLRTLTNAVFNDGVAGALEVREVDDGGSNVLRALKNSLHRIHGLYHLRNPQYKHACMQRKKMSASATTWVIATDKSMKKNMYSLVSHLSSWICL